MKKISIVGNRGHLNVVLNDIKKLGECEIAGVCGAGSEMSVQDVAESCTRVLGQTPAQFEGDYRAMLDVAKPDVLVVCGPFEDHAAMTVEAMDRGIHVFCEKPIATTLEGLAELAKAHRRHPDVKIAQMCGPHYDVGMWSATRHLSEIGTVRLMNAQKSYKLGKREAFFMRRRTSSGLIPWVGIHAISWLYHFAGRTPFKAVCAAHSSDFNKDHGDLEMSAACLFEFEGGVSASASIDYLRPENPSIGHGDDRIRVMGTGGSIEVRDGICHWFTASESETFCDAPPFGMFEDFLRAVNGDPANIMTGIDLLRVTQASLLAREAADLHQRLSVPAL
ncbi:MAG: Gfo/Idh/MocA family protein [Kiritimatiellia bacterium]